MSIDGQTKTFGILGCPVSHTASPEMHAAGYLHHNINAVYVPFEVATDRLALAIQGIRALGILGVNVTIPHKEAVLPFLDHCDPQALKIGAVNTIVNQNGILTGYNTDGLGFLKGIDEELGQRPPAKLATILGTGGSARSIAVSLLEAGCEHLVLGYRTSSLAQQLAAQLQTLFPSPKIEVESLATIQESDTLRRPQLVVQTTPVGMSPNTDQSVLSSFDWVTTEHLCVDIIYKPEVTLFLEKTKEKGAQVLGGAAMLAAQGCIAFELMTGKSVPYSLFRAQL